MGNPWEREKEHEGFVQLPRPYQRKLYAKVCGPQRKKREQPLVILFTGGGAPCAVYVRLIREVSTRWRVLAYDRAGYDRSEVSWIDGDGDGDGDPEMRERSDVGKVFVGWEGSKGRNMVVDREKEGKRKIMARDSAEELKALLEAIEIRGPYVLVAHSYGAIVAREFIDVMNCHYYSDTRFASKDGWDNCDVPLHQNRNEVIGLALIEPASELLYHTYQPSIPPPCFDALLEGVDVDKVMRLREESGLSDEEWETALSAVERTNPAAECEDNRGSAWLLADKKQMEKHILDPGPVTVLRCDWYDDWKKLYDAGVEAGNGNQEERSEAERFLWEVGVFGDEVRAGLVRLTGKGGQKRRYSYFRGCGHDVPVRRPDVVVREVQWVMDRLEEKGLRREGSADAQVSGFGRR